MLFILFAFAAIAVMFAHGAILAQFIGTTDDVLVWLSVVQGLALVGSAAFLLAHLSSLDQPLWDKQDGLMARVRKVWARVPGWVIFAVILVVANVLLGEISILISRLTGHTLSVWQHTPTFSIIVASVICIIAIASCSGPRPPRGQYGPDSQH